MTLKRVLNNEIKTICPDCNTKLITDISDISNMDFIIDVCCINQITILCNREQTRIDVYYEDKHDPQPPAKRRYSYELYKRRYINDNKETNQ